MPNLIRVSTGAIIAENWIGPPPSNAYVLDGPMQPFAVIPPIPTPDDQWAPIPPTELGAPTTTTADDTFTIRSGAGSRIDWAREYVNLARIAPRAEPRPQIRLERERDMPKPSFKHFEQALGKVNGKSGFQTTKAESYIGLELENEALKEVQWPNVRGWTFHNEGSLRGYGFEYVQIEPNTIRETLGLLENLLSVMHTRIGKVSNSIRTSTHVHFDCTKYNFLDIINFSCLYWMLESFLSHYCGESRKGNLFCLRLKDATQGQILLQEAIKTGAPYGVPLIRNDYRYSSLNFSSLQKFGSLEFRMLRGTDDYMTVVNWVNALEAIKQYALKFKTPLDLHRHFIKEVDAKDLPRLVLGSDLFKEFNAQRPKIPVEAEVREGFLSVSSILTAHKTWDFTEDIKAEAERDQKEQEEWARHVEAETRRRALRDQLRANPVEIDPQSGPDELPDQDTAGIDVIFRQYNDE